MELDPWKISDISNYEQLFNFGMRSFSPFHSHYSDNRYMRRGIIFGHRDFEKIDRAISRKEPFIMMTGLMPSGRFHFGHKMVADEIVWFQGKGARVYIAIADIESYLMRGVPLDIAKKIALEEYIANYIALGLDPERSHFWFQSSYRPEYYRLSDMAAQEITLNELRAIYGDLTPSKIISVLKQVSDILHAQLPELEGKLPTVVPVGADQDPHIRLTRDIASRLSRTYDFELPSATFHRFMEGLQGGKMSSSDQKSYIALTESPESAKKKVMSAKTGGRETADEQRRLGGVPEQCVVYKLYYYHLVDDDREMERIYNECKTGAILCGECKRRCASMLEDFLQNHQEKMRAARDTAKQVISEQRSEFGGEK